MKAVWLSDIHLNCVEPDVLKEFLSNIAAEKPDCVLISGDISISNQLTMHLYSIERAVDAPVYFVCGNHDFWGSSFSGVADIIKDVCSYNSNINWLSNSSYVTLHDKTVLVGHDCYYDAGYGNWQGSKFFLNDWFHIDDLRAKDMHVIVNTVKKYAIKGCNHIKNEIEAAIINGAKNAIVLIHPPPFPQASLYKGHAATIDSLPWYSCKAAGDMLLSIANAHPKFQIDVLCGHTHSDCRYSPCTNLRVHVSGAEYYSPRYKIITL
jgi:predicted phosphohydrolase